MNVLKFRALRTNVVELEKPTPKRVYNQNNTLPPDEYMPLLDEVALPIDSENERINKELHFNCARAGEMGLPHVDIRMAVFNNNPERFSGKTTRSIKFPTENLDEIIDTLCWMREELRKKKLL